MSIKYLVCTLPFPLYLNIDKINGYIKDSNGKKYLTLVPTDKCKDTLKKCKELQDKMRQLIRSITINSDNCDIKYMKVKFNLDDSLSLKKTLNLYNMAIIVKSVFHEGNK